MEGRELLVDAFGRIEELYADLVTTDPALLHVRPSGVGNSIGWLLWHAARVQDDHVAGVAGTGQAWLEGWAERFALPLDDRDIGFGHTPEQVSAVRVQPDLLAGYHADVHRLTLGYVSSVSPEELDRIVDRHWDPPVTAGVRLVSVVGDCLQHLGQAAYVRGLLVNGG